MPNQSLALTQDQRMHLILAPQLRQSLEMLQAPILELRTMVRAELDRNPTLEEAALDTTPIGTGPGGTEPEDQKAIDFRKEFETLARLDDEWRDYFFQQKEAMPYSSDAAEKRQYLFDSVSQETSLQEHLLQQLALTSLNDNDLKVGELIIGSLNDDGYLSNTVDDLATTAGVDVAHIQDILSVIQDFDPSGVGARDLRECLLLQLERLDKIDSVTERIVQEHLDVLGAHKYQELAKALDVPVEQVQNAAAFIATLEPKPGRAYSSEQSPYISPEVVVKRLEGRYVVFLNDDDLPRLRISKHYRSLMHANDTTDEVKTYIQERIRSGAFLIKSIHQRQQTIHRIAGEIVRVQTDFLENGVSHLKPLTMAEVARAVGLHETTVSRAVAGKHIQTPVGTFELKYFFTPGVKTDDGKVVSNKAVKDVIANLVSRESPTNPLSDQDIQEKLKEMGIPIARRTIAKYRLALRIPPSHLRKTYL